MQKLLQKPLLQQRIYPNLKLQNPLNLLPSFLQHLDAPPQIQNVCNFKTGKELNRISTLSSLQEDATIDNRFHVFPSFSFELFLNPKLSSGLHHVEALKGDHDDSRIIWADSVKKKRKRKMNKHKLRKLRKRVRGYA